MNLDLVFRWRVVNVMQVAVIIGLCKKTGFPIVISLDDTPECARHNKAGSALPGPLFMVDAASRARFEPLLAETVSDPAIPAG